MEERTLTTEKRLSKMEEKLDNIAEKVNNIASDIKDHVKWEAEKYEKLDNKYSAKWVETGVISIITAIIIAAIAGIFKYFMP